MFKIINILLRFLLVLPKLFHIEFFKSYEINFCDYMKYKLTLIFPNG